MSASRPPMTDPRPRSQPTADSASARSGGYACVHCRTVLPLGVHDCPECSGAASSGVRADGSSSRGAPWLLLDAVVVLRGWMVLFAVVAILVLFALVLFVDERHVQPWGVEYGFLAVEAALLVAGLFLLTSHPVAWVVASGTVVTIDAARILATGDVPVMRLAIAGALWLGLPTARWVQQLVTRDPSSYVARALAGTPSEWRKARGDEKGAGEILQQSRKRALVRGLVSGFVVLALAIGAAAWRVAGIERRPEPVVEEPRSFGELAAEFDRAWRASDVEALGELCGEDGVEARGELREGLARRGWRGALPPIRGQRLETGALNAELVLTLDAGEARARLGAKSVGRDEPAYEWRLVELELPRPPMDEFATRFAEAWRSADPDAVLACFAPERAETVRAALAELGAREGWSGARPSILGCTPRALPYDHAELRCPFAGGELVVSMQLAPVNRWQAVLVNVARN